MKETFGELAEKYRACLLDDCIPFWERNSIDRECGGFLTSLGRDGKPYDTDKWIWLQGRQIWTFSMLYNRLEKRPEWLDIARHGFEFLTKYGMDSGGNFYFGVTRDGKPLVEAYNIFSDCFAAMAFSQYALASGDERAKDLALSTFKKIMQRWENPKGRFSKIVPGTRPMKSFALPMITSNLMTELSWMLDPAETDRVVTECIEEVMSVFLDSERGLIFEHVAPDGSHPDTFDGRLINPGHGIEGMWFVMDIARRKGDKALIDRAVDTVMNILDYSWDPEFGGIFYFMDSEGKPPQQLEWDLKLWWAHLETLVALAMGYQLTGRADCWSWYERVHDYVWGKFPDPGYGEWFGYLNRRGEVLLDLKGGKWKGCFHLPRAMFMCYRIFSSLQT